jgi:hypothetical protein
MAPVDRVTNSPPSMRTDSYQVSETAQVKTRDLRRASVEPPMNVPPSDVPEPLQAPPFEEGHSSERWQAGAPTERRAPVGSVRDQSGLTVRNIHCSLPLFNLHRMA